ncbi:hypothetical protein ETU09_05745 [Apibacter muscae]|uniref:Uncharacterized protein n=1 Tax=Apibacter muscae TaxID=2509004 RepID=A0A563DDZ9_9FLAO|nr:hypothetical protein [Apibacter muscae]TWP28426.1 hypothetical protein ETU09_05745 [Apibacter muscae]
MKPLIIESHAMYDLIVHPNFENIAGNYSGSYSGTLNEFTVYNDVSLSNGTPIIDIFSKNNNLQRKDASCKTNWKQIAKGSTRKIKIDELYGATEDCQEEFYQGCLADFSKYSPKFQEMILNFFKESLGTDLASNSYFGDISRPDDEEEEWSWNKFDGIFAKYAKYIEKGGDLKPTVLDAVPEGDISGPQAYAIFKEAYENQSYILQGKPGFSKAFYVDWDLANGLKNYYQQIGANGGIIGYLMNGIPTLMFEDIPVFVEPIWKPVLTRLNKGKKAHALILTLRGNFLFGTNKNYGGGKDKKQALRVWWSEDDEVWRYKMHLTAGTDIATPQHSVLALTEIKN